MPPKKSTPVTSTSRKPAAGRNVPKKNVPAASKTSTKASMTGGKVKTTGKTVIKSSSKTKVAVSKVSKESKAAVKIQSVVRRFLAQKQLIKTKKEKQDYDALIENLQKEAWLEIVRREREEEDKRKEKEDAERKRKTQEKKWVKVFLESAFDGELDDMKKILKEIEENIRKISDLNDGNLQRKVERSRNKMINCEDANSNSALSEASAGGDLDTVMFLLQNGAKINSIGHFHRTPLYRAAFGGHLDVLTELLKNGGDPRILDNDGVLPSQIAATPEIVSFLQAWDVSSTDILLLKIEETHDEFKIQEEAYIKEEQKKLKNTIGELEADYSNKQKILQKTYTELNKRIEEHDKCVAKGFDRTDVTLQCIHDAEVDLARSQRHEEESRQKLFQAKLILREQKADGDHVEDPRIAKCNFKELDQVLMLDVGDVVKNSGKWPLLIDSSNQAVTFLRYRDTNYLNLLNPKDVENEVLRKALLGAIRFGKSLVLDMLEVDMMEFLEVRLNEIQDNLFNDIIHKEIVSSNRYINLIRSDDGKEYLKENFNEERMDRFQVIMISKMIEPPEKWLDVFYSIKIVIPVRE